MGASALFRFLFPLTLFFSRQFYFGIDPLELCVEIREKGVILILVRGHYVEAYIVAVQSTAQKAYTTTYYMHRFESDKKKLRQKEARRDANSQTRHPSFTQQ